MLGLASSHFCSFPLRNMLVPGSRTLLSKANKGPALLPPHSGQLSRVSLPLIWSPSAGSWVPAAPPWVLPPLLPSTGSTPLLPPPPQAL